MPPDPETEQRIQQLLARCNADMQSHEFQSVITNCRTILALDPDHMRAREMMEDAQSKLEAEVFVRENLKRAQEFFQTRAFQKCISECQRIQLLDSENSAAGDLLKKAQQKMEAEPFIQNFIGSGQSLFNSGLYSEAVAQWEKVRSIDPQYQGLDTLIRSAKEKMAPEIPEFPGVPDLPSFDLGTGMDMSDQISDVPLIGFDEQQAAGAPAAEPATDEERIERILKDGDQFFNRGQYQKAIEVWAEVFMLDVTHPVALQKIEEARVAANSQRVEVKEWMAHGEAAYEEGDVEKARDFFEQVVAVDPNNAEANKYLSRIGQQAKGPSSLQELIALGDTAEEGGRYREAAQYFSQALALDSENAVLADRIRNINVLAKKQEQGKALFGNARAFLAEGKANSARHALTKILEADPANQEALELMKEVKQAEASSPGMDFGEMKSPVSRPAGATVRGGKKFPIVPALVGVVVVLALAGGAVFFMKMRKPVDTKSIEIPKKVVKQTPANTPKTQAVQPQTVPAVVLSPETRDKAVKLVQEAAFYYQAGHLTEAQQKVTEALTTDPENKDGQSLMKQVDSAIAQAQAAEQKMLTDATSYFNYSEFAGAVELYEKYLKKHPEAEAQVQPQIIKCYFNLGVISMRTYNCDRGADYFRQVLFIDTTDQLSKDALAVAHQCQKAGATDLEVRKAVALMEMRK
jgi:tetratricopeptide (TPR) repeat protein